MPNVPTVHPSVPVRSLKELVALAKSRPGQLQYASPRFGSTAHLAMELLMSMSGIKMGHVPYKSGGAAFVSVQSGEMLMMFGNVMSVSFFYYGSGRNALSIMTIRPQR
jgi:tripartite-type tricarboxylate transporter receptor subunit TctC